MKKELKIKHFSKRLERWRPKRTLSGLAFSLKLLNLVALVLFLAVFQPCDLEAQTRDLPSLNPGKAAEEVESSALVTQRIDPNRQKTLSLFVGMESQEKLPFLPPGAKLRGDYRNITKLSVDPKAGILQFQPTKEGFGTLTIFDADNNRLYDFALDVRKSNLAKVATEMRALLADIEGITIKIINNRVVVDGQVLLPRDLSRVIGVVQQFGDALASSLVTLSPAAQRKIAALIRAHIDRPEISVTPINEKFVLEGTVNDPGERDRAVQIAEMYVPDTVKEAGEGTQITKLRKIFILNLIQVRPPPPREPSKIIQIAVHFVELSKTYSKGFKFQFTPEITDGTNLTLSNDSRSPGGVVSSITAVISNLLPKLNWAKEHGHARVLESTTLLVTDGSEGRISNETEIPFTIFSPATNNAASASSKIGLTAKIGAKINNPRSDAIELAMDFSMAQLVDMTSNGPIISNSAVNTKVTVRSGQSAAIGGLILNTNNTAYNKLPPAVQNPLVTLYASKQFNRKQSQFVVFVTPMIKISASQGAEKIKAKFKLKD